MTTKHTRKHPLKVAGEVQMKALSHDMTMLRRENEKLRADREKLVEALRNARNGMSRALNPVGGDSKCAEIMHIDNLLRSLGED